MESSQSPSNQRYHLAQAPAESAEPTVREAAGLDQTALNQIMKSMFVIQMAGGRTAKPGLVAMVLREGQAIADAVAAAGPGLVSRPKCDCGFWHPTKPRAEHSPRCASLGARYV